MTQASQPTPQNPVYPQETGDKTANLFNPNDSTAQTAGCTYTVSNNAVTQSNTSAYSRTIWKIDNLTVGSKYTISLDYTNNDACSVQIRIMDNDNSGIIAATGTTTDTIGTLTLTFTAATTTHYIRLYSNTLNTSNNYSVVFNNIMLNNGETAMNFEPYGYKIPISLSQNTYNIYITEPLRKSLDGSNVYDTIESNGTLTRRVDENGDALATPTTEQVTVPTLTTTGTAEQFNVLTTLAPSEVSLTYHGWHEHEDTKFTT